MEDITTNEISLKYFIQQSYLEKINKIYNEINQSKIILIIFIFLIKKTQ